MLEMITGETIASEVEMVRTSFKGAILIVEGDKDESLFRKFTDNSSCNIIIAYGKEKVLAAMEILNKDNKTGILGFVDADFWRLEEYVHGIPNILTSDLNDTESMIISSSAFERVVKEYCSDAKVAKISDLRSFLFERAATIGILRFASRKFSLNLSFQSLDYGKITAKNCIDININTLVRHVSQLTVESRKEKGIAEKVPPDKEIIEKCNEIVEATKSISDMTLLCCGHDLMGLFAVGLRRLLASLTAAVAEHENVEKIFRLAYDTADFLTTSLANAMLEWEKSNPPYKLLGTS
jgi:hypothetical protein